MVNKSSLQIITLSKETTGLPAEQKANLPSGQKVNLSSEQIPSLPSEQKSSLLESFSRFNKEWITHYFRLEPSDIRYLSNPEENILEKGGYIFVALLEGEPVGCCALIPHADTSQWELAKMAVTPSAQGHGVGSALGRAALQKAQALGIEALFLEANTLLEASVHLYEHLGFEAVADYTPAYERCNLFMVCKLTNRTHS